MYSAPDGNVADFHVMHYGARSFGGAALIIVEATGVEPRGRITDNCLGIYSDSHIAGLSRIVSAIKAGGAVAAIQLGHGGRKSTATGGVSEIIAPSAIAYDDKYRTPKAMDDNDITTVIAAFKEAARRAQAAGFDMVEIHGAHGYLLSTFMSPLSNKRSDRYGGGHENRVRIVGEVLNAVKSVFSGVICIRVSAEDYLPEGNHPADVAAMINIVKAGTLDLINVSSASVAPARFPFFPGYQVKLAEQIKQLTGLPVIAGGLLSSPEHMEDIIANGRADMVYVGRELLRNPHFPLFAAQVLRSDFPWPKQYERAAAKPV